MLCATSLPDYNTMGGGVITLVGSHVIDLITYLTGERAVRVHSVVKTFNPNTSAISGIRNITSPDYCVFQLELTGGALVTVTLNTHLAQSTFTQEILICGPKGYLVVRNGDLYGFKNGCGKEDVLYLDVEDMNFNSDVIPKPYIKGLFKMISALKESFLNIEENKSGWIKQPVSVASTFDDGLYIQGVIEAIQRSNLNREWTKVSIITQEPDPNPLLSAAVRRSGITMS
uniref:Glucose-fructose oxidoreductase domain-containing protein 2 n=1 Tax=Cacopsylla melanoneura TaxID=428564 RepID=A0A8D8L9G8_9HEMI